MQSRSVLSMSNPDQFPAKSPTGYVILTLEEPNSLVTRGLEAIKSREMQSSSLAIDADSEKLFQEARNARLQGDYETQRRLLLMLAERGNVRAQFFLGLSYSAGTPKNNVEAVKWFSMAAKQGYAEAQASLGLSYRNGTGVHKDDAEAVKWCRKAAEQGDARGQLQLGHMYLSGSGVQEDYVEAVKWYSKAAEQGHSTAQLALGLSYYVGWGVQKDYTEAVKWYRQSAEQGEPKAYYQLGVAYHKGDGVPKDSVQAYMWFILSGSSRFAESATEVSAKKELDNIKEYMTQKQIAEAQRLAQEWTESHAS